MKNKCAAIFNKEKDIWNKKMYSIYNNIGDENWVSKRFSIEPLLERDRQWFLCVNYKNPTYGKPLL